MKRRSFLGFLGAAPLAALVPMRRAEPTPEQLAQNITPVLPDVPIAPAYKMVVYRENELNRTIVRVSTQFEGDEFGLEAAIDDREHRALKRTFRPGANYSLDALVEDKHKLLVHHMNQRLPRACPRLVLVENVISKRVKVIEPRGPWLT